jgi:hypothetical protein
LLTDSQAQAFEAWYRDAITDGAAWFNMNLRTPGGGGKSLPIYGYLPKVQTLGRKFWRG